MEAQSGKGGTGILNKLVRALLRRWHLSNSHRGWWRSTHCTLGESMLQAMETVQGKARWECAYCSQATAKRSSEAGRA